MGETKWPMKGCKISKEGKQIQQSEQKLPGELEMLQEMGEQSMFRVFLKIYLFIWLHQVLVVGSSMKLSDSVVVVALRHVGS